jgi:hypothetical protein
VNVSPGNGGLVKIDDKTTDAYPTTQTFTANQGITMTAIPNEGFGFTGWTGYSTISTETAHISMTCNMSYTANFVPVTYQISTAISPANSGEIILKPLEPEGGYPFGTNVTVTAKPSSGFTFKEWTENPGVTSNPFILVVTIDKTVTAVFEEKQSSSLGWIIGGVIAGIIVVIALLYFVISRKQHA